jgi:hypothetical protein
MVGELLNIMDSLITQKKAVLSHMQTRGSITPMEALRLYGCFRLGARIWDLEREGYIIDHKMERSAGKRFAVYSLVKQDTNGQLSFL